MWRTVPDRNGNFVSFPSVRTPGATVYQDPITPTSGFYRSLAIEHPRASRPTRSSPAGYGDTGANPTSLVVPGNAAVATDGAGLYGGLDTTAGRPRRSRPAPGSASSSSPPRRRPRRHPGRGRRARRPVDRRLHARHATSRPRDSTAPVVRVLDPGAAVLAQRRRPARHRVAARPVHRIGRLDAAGSATAPTTSCSTTTGTGSTFQVGWDGMVGGASGPGRHLHGQRQRRRRAGATARRGATRELTVDTAAPELAGLTPGASTTQWFSPNGDGVRDTVSLTATNSRAGLDRDPGRRCRRRAGQELDGGQRERRRRADLERPNDGRWLCTRTAPTASGSPPTDVAGNTGSRVERTVNVVGALRSVASTRSLFFPQDLDTLDRTTTLSFTLARPMTVTWTLRNAAGQIGHDPPRRGRPAGRHPDLDLQRPASGRHDAAARSLHLVRVRDRRDPDRARQAATFDMEAFKVKLERHDPEAGPVDHGDRVHGRAPGQAPDALRSTSPGSLAGASG